MMRVDYRGSDAGYDEEEAMLAVFGTTGPVQLRADAIVRYQSANYDELVPGLWTGELAQLRTQSQIRTFEDEEGLWRMERTTPVVTSDETTFYAYSPRTQLFVAWERGQFPHTRFRSFVQRARMQHGVRMRLEPVLEQFTVWDMLSHFDVVTSLSVRYRRAQSPGVAFIDDYIDTAGAETVQERMTAKRGAGLNIEALRDEHIGQAIEHIAVNEKNGVVTAKGEVGEERLDLRSDKPVMRRKAESPRDAMAYARAVRGIIRGLVP